MLIPVIIITGLLGFVIYLSVSSNKRRKQEYDAIAASISQEILFQSGQVRSFTVTSGLKNREFLFRHCDFYATPDALVIFGYSKDSILIQRSVPIILTKATMPFAQRFPFAYVAEINSILFKEGNTVEINFGGNGLLKTHIFLRLKFESEVPFNKLKEMYS